MQNGKTIEAFIITYNRKDLLKDSIQSLLNQTIGNLETTVMDNGSTDGTEAVVNELQATYPNLHYHKREVNNSLEIFKDVIRLAEKDYMILFHDDDILHPDYFKYAMKAINKYPNTAIVAASYKEHSNPDNKNWEKIFGSFYYFNKKNDFVDFLCYHKGFGYSSTIYKTDNLKRIINNMPDISKYGKICDKPFVIETMQENDGAIIFKDKHFLRYRVHPGQDTQASGPYYNEIIEFNRFYKSIMTRNWYSNFLFNLINYKQLKNGYIWGNDNTLTLNEFIQKAIDENAGCYYTKLCISRGGKFFIELAHILRKIFKSNYKNSFIF